MLDAGGDAAVKTRSDAAATSVPPDAVLCVSDLSVGFEMPGGLGRTGIAVENVSFTLKSGKTFCLVGESGCGKTVTAMSLLRLLPSPPTRILGGRVLFDGRDLASLSEKELAKLRGDKAGVIFQDPMTSLNPVMRVGEQMTEGLMLHRGISKSEAKKAAVALLERVGIADAAARVSDFPHQMSGGMRQRVMIGMALACDPRLLIADEPTTALDVTVQKQILGLMRRLIDGADSSLLLITHDLGVVAQVADEVGVMYAGRIVEQGDVTQVLQHAAHPYTLGLLHSRPGSAARKTRLPAIPGTVPDIWSRPAGCPFHPRCAQSLDLCRQQAPPLFPLEDGHKAACWLHGQADTPDRP